MTNNSQEDSARADRFQTEYFREYTSPEAISKYTRATAGHGISYLLDHDYKDVYLRAFDSLPDSVKKRGIRILEFGCGGGMNLLHLMSVLRGQGVQIERAIGTDFSPVLIEAAQREAKNFLGPEERQRVDFYQAKNENLVADLSAALTKERSQLQGSFDFIFGVNTIRYCHDADNELDCAKNIFELLVPGGVCVVIDMNCRFPLFRSDLKNRLRGMKEEECYVASLEEYAEPFIKAGFSLERKEHFCWIPHSSGQLLCGIMRLLSPLLNIVAPSRAMRALVVARRPI
jgi:SAM-dependent methyltransferase